MEHMTYRGININHNMITGVYYAEIISGDNVESVVELRARSKELSIVKGSIDIYFTKKNESVGGAIPAQEE